MKRKDRSPLTNQTVSLDSSYQLKQFQCTVEKYLWLPWRWCVQIFFKSLFLFGLSLVVFYIIIYFYLPAMINQSLSTLCSQCWVNDDSLLSFFQQHRATQGALVYRNYYHFITATKELPATRRGRALCKSTCRKKKNSSYPTTLRKMLYIQSANICSPVPAPQKRNRPMSLYNTFSSAHTLLRSKAIFI